MEREILGLIIVEDVLCLHPAAQASRPDHERYRPREEQSLRAVHYRGLDVSLDVSADVQELRGRNSRLSDNGVIQRLVVGYAALELIRHDELVRLLIAAAAQYADDDIPRINRVRDNDYLLFGALCLIEELLAEAAGEGEMCRELALALHQLVLAEGRELGGFREDIVDALYRGAARIAELFLGSFCGSTAELLEVLFHCRERAEVLLHEHENVLKLGKSGGGERTCQAEADRLIVRPPDLAEHFLPQLDLLTREGDTGLEMFVHSVPPWCQSVETAVVSVFSDAEASEVSMLSVVVVAVDEDAVVGFSSPYSGMSFSPPQSLIYSSRVIAPSEL